MRDEAEIIKGCLKGNRSSQEALYKRYAPKMLGLCVRYFKTLEEAEDVLQEGFIRVFTYLNQFKGHGSLEGWIRRIMINTALNAYRSNLKHCFHSNIDELENRLDFIGESSDNSSKEDMLKLIQNLPIGYNLVFNLYEIEGYSHKEIAKKLGITESTSKSQLHKAKKILQKQLTSIGIEYKMSSEDENE